jgi:benzoylformate decarboxylase
MAFPQGPTFVSIPEDDWDAPGDPVAARAVRHSFSADPTALDAVATAFDRAERPCLVVGAGVDRDGAFELAVALAERTRAAVWAAPLSSRCSFPEDHPCFAGFLVPQRDKLTAQLAGHDVVLVLGAPVFTYHVHSDGPGLPPGAELFQLTDDPGSAAAAPAGTAIITTLRAGLEGLLERVEQSRRPAPEGRTPAPPPKIADPIDARLVMATIRALMPPDAIVVEEAPTHRNAMHDHLPITAPGAFFVAASGGLGWGLPAAVGIALGAPGRPVVCVLGDGSTMYSIQALWTAAQLELPITYVVLDNRGYVALKALGGSIGVTDPPGVDLPGVDIAAVAAGLGCTARRVTHAAELFSALTETLNTRMPTLTVVEVDSAVQTLY